MMTRSTSFCTHLRLACWWGPYSFSVQVHVEHGAEWLYCRLAIELGSHRIQRFYIPAHFRVRLCYRLQPNSLKTIRYLRSRGMWHRSPVATFMHLAYCIGLLRSLSSLEITFLVIESRQHWFGCCLEKNSNGIILSSTRILDRSPSSWSTKSWKHCD